MCCNTNRVQNSSFGSLWKVSWLSFISAHPITFNIAIAIIDIDNRVPLYML